MKNLLEYILIHLVDYKNDILVNEIPNDQGTIILQVSANKMDIGKIIGKNGRTIKAIRNIVSILALKQNKFVDIVLSE
jgi:uncharacterized protein